MTEQEATEKLLELLAFHTEGRTMLEDARPRQLAMQWPSLAAVLHELLVAHGKPSPRPFRLAAGAVNTNERMGSRWEHTRAGRPGTMRVVPEVDDE